MDIDNLQQNMNTRVVFKEPRGMIRWIQLFFAIIAFSTVADFYTTIVVDITCPPVVQIPVVQPAPAVPAPAPAATNAAATGASSVAPGVSSTMAATPAVAVVTAAPPAAPVTQAQVLHPKLEIAYPFDFSQQQLKNECPNHNSTYVHTFSSLSGSPQFFVMTGVLSLMYASASLVVYLFFSSTYESVPVWPVADLLVAAILCLFWFIASCSFSSGVSLLKTTTIFEPTIRQTLCPDSFLNTAGASCVEVGAPSWKSLHVGIVSGFTSFFLWGAGLWFVYKETHFHTPRDNFGAR